MQVYEVERSRLALRRELRFSQGFESLTVIPERAIALAVDSLSRTGRIEAWSLEHTGGDGPND